MLSNKSYPDSVSIRSGDRGDGLHDGGTYKRGTNQSVAPGSCVRSSVRSSVGRSVGRSVRSSVRGRV